MTDYTKLIERLNAAIDENAFEETNTALQDAVAAIEALQARVKELERRDDLLSSACDKMRINHSAEVHGYIEELAKLRELETDRDEWKDSTIAANQRFKQAEAKLRELEADYAAKCSELEIVHDAHDAKLRELESQQPIGHLDGTDISAEFMSVALRAEHEARDSHTPKLFTVPVFTHPVPAAPTASPKCSQCQTPNSCGSDGKCLEEYIAARLKQAAPTASELMTEYSNGKLWALEEALKVAEDSAHIVDVDGYHAQLGDASATQRDIVEAIRKLKEGL